MREVETMKLTNEDRETIRIHLADYLREPTAPVRGKVAQRTEAWSFGKTMQAIADDEHVTMSSVQKSIHALAPRVLKYAEERNANND